MLKNLTWNEIPVYKIQLPGEKQANLTISCGEYLFNHFRIGEKEKELFSTEAAELLATIHPIIIRSPENYCIFGLRTLFIVSSIIPTSTIRVGVLPSSISEQEIGQLIRADAWLSRVMYATKSPETGLFHAKKSIPKDLLTALTPGLDLNVSDLSRLLGVSIPTLYGKQKKGIGM